MTVCETLRDNNKDIWAELHNHLFVKELVAGTLPGSKFAFYIGQNAHFLREQSRAMAQGIAKADNEDLMRDFARATTNIVNFELPQTRSMFEKITETEPATGAAEMAPATLAYVSYLQATAYAGRAVDIMASLLPCQWSYGEIAEDYADDPPEHPVYRDWVEFFSGQEYRDALDANMEEFEELADGLGDSDMDRINTIWRMCCRLEYGFWEGAYKLQTWVA